MKFSITHPLILATSLFALTSLAALADDASALTSKLPPCTSAEVEIAKFPNSKKTLTHPAAEQLSTMWRKLTYRPASVWGQTGAEYTYIVRFYNQKTLLVEESIMFEGQIITFLRSDKVPSAANLGSISFDAKSEEAQKLQAFLKNQFPNSK